jgi:two-component system, response regulator, stage 0 sporulation protein A
MRNDLFQEVLSLRKEVAELKALVLKKEINNRELSISTKAESTDDRIAHFLQELQISSNLKGYSYLREAIKRVYEDMHLVRAFTTVLYPEIAQIYQTIPQRVERAIRHAIESSYSKNYYHSFYQQRYKNQKPTNSQFIVDIADQLMMEDRLKSEVM